MKHAILIMAHKNFTQLRHLVEYFSRDCYVFIHIDKKGEITPSQANELMGMANVTNVYRKYAVHWGGFSILKCEMFLLKQALKECDADYIHLISGQDYPIKPLGCFLRHFEQNAGKDFIRYNIIPNAGWDKYTYSRFQYYYPYDFLSDRGEKARKTVSRILSIEKKLGVKRRIPDHFPYLYGSTQWFSLTRSSVEKILDYTRNHPKFYRRSRFTFASEEYYMATILCNISSKENIIARDLRFIRWKNENDSYPAILTNEHFRILANSEDFFARKLEYPQSLSLIENIDKYLLSEENISVRKTGAWAYKGYQAFRYDEQLVAAIRRIYVDYGLSSALDIGCGPGQYVSALRLLGVPIIGFDANPHTPELSKCILNNDKDLCVEMDLTENMDEEDAFDLTLCLDVLPYIPESSLEKAVSNISLLTNKFSFVSWENDRFRKQGFSVNRNMLEPLFNKHQMRMNIYLTKEFERLAYVTRKHHEIMVLEKT